MSSTQSFTDIPVQGSRQYNPFPVDLQYDHFDFSSLSGSPFPSDFDSSFLDHWVKDLKDDPNGAPSSTNKEGCCINSASKIIQDLHTAPSTCYSAGAARPLSAASEQRTTGAILSKSREAIQLISEMSQCPCFASCQTRLIHANICYKLISWYRSILKNNSNFLHDFSHQDPQLRTGPPNLDHRDLSEYVVDQPITVGDYTIDVSLQSKIRAQIVLVELQNLEASLCDLLHGPDDTK